MRYEAAGGGGLLRPLSRFVHGPASSKGARSMGGLSKGGLSKGDLSLLGLSSVRLIEWQTIVRG